MHRCAFTMMFSIAAIFYIYLLHGVSSRPTHQLTTEVAVPENITALNSATNVTRTVNETDIDGYVNLEGPVQDSWVEDPKGEPEPNTDTTSAATAAVTTGSPTPPPIPVTIDAELMGQVLMSLNDARQEASGALENYGNHPDVLRALQENEYISTLNFAALVASSFPILPALNSTTQDTSQQERLIVVDRESRILLTLSHDLLRLEKSHVTRHGGECGVETSDININYFCDETQGSMNRLVGALNEFQLKLGYLVSSSSEEDQVKFPLPGDGGSDYLVRYNVLSGLYQIQQRIADLETVLETFGELSTR